MENKFRFQALQDLVKKGKTPSVEHIGEMDAESLGIPWEDKDYNYRINPGYETQYLTDKNNNTLGHFALDEDNVTRSVYIDPKYQGQGLGYKAHEALASKIPIQMDDANEPAIYKIWDKLKEQYPNKIKQIGETAEGKPRYGFTEKLQHLGGGKFKSLASALPLAGTAMALSSGDASAAVDELPSEIPGVGQVYDVLRSDSAGSAEDDKMMINEVKALQNYDKSPAHQARLKALQGLGTKK